MANRSSVTLTIERPRCASVRVESGRISCTPAPALSGTMVQVCPAGIAVTGCPDPSSVTNSSPSPPTRTLAAPVASPTRTSGSAPGRALGGRWHAAARTARTLTSARFAKRRVELLDREIDVRIRVCAGDKGGLERRRRQKHAARQGGSVPAGEQRGVGRFRLGVVAYGSGGEVNTPHRARVTRADRDAATPGRVRYTRHQPRGSALQGFVEPGRGGRRE